jgi:hypothetical protein
LTLSYMETIPTVVHNITNATKGCNQINENAEK